MKITVIGDGAWGTALALLLVRNGHEVSLWGPFPEYLQEMEKTRENTKFLPGVKLDQGLRFTADPADAADTNLWLVAAPTQYMRKVLEQFKPFFRPEQHIVLSVAKGIEVESWMRIDELVYSIFGECRFCALSGPSHAEEVARGVPTAVTVASAAPGCAELVQQLMMTSSFRIYTSHDPIGVLLGGAIKNVMAIAAGVIDGMQLGDNPKAAMMTRAVAEMGRLGAALGGNAATFSGLAGIGDLIVTCCSQYSRNRHVGEELGRGKKLDQILQEMGMSVAEGVATARGICALANQVAVEVPICRQIFAVLYEDLDPKIAVRNLMTRAARAEME
ncbi:MAG: NAD(P)-dependent glycerol-3-phosphate dehydrogenase [Lentisphaeria bacterium]|nr:NAD(P)-dependent glycerol-3-phosphate dehydrogenase [Lentisphaeria bacterium]